MNTLLLGAIILLCLFGFVWMMVKAAKSFEKEQKMGKQKKIYKDQYKGGIQ